MEEAEKYTEIFRIVFLITEPSNLVENYCRRPDHQGFSNFINSTSDEVLSIIIFYAIL